MKTLRLLAIISTALLCCMFTCNEHENEDCKKLLGNWKDAYKLRTKICFETGGKYAVIQDYTLNFKTKDTLYNGYEVLVRQSGTTGIVGSWKVGFDTGEWLISYFNTDKSYSYEWDNGDKGTGHYTINGSDLRVFEYRASYACDRDSLAITSVFTNATSKYNFTIADTVLSLIAKDTTLVMIRF